MTVGLTPLVPPHAPLFCVVTGVLVVKWGPTAANPCSVGLLYFHRWTPRVTIPLSPCSEG